VSDGDREGRAARGEAEKNAGREDNEQGGKYKELGVHFYTLTLKNT